MLIRLIVAPGAGLLGIAACSPPSPKMPAVDPAPTAGSVLAVHDTTVEATFDADGVAQPLRQATLSTKLTGTVLSVFVREGDAVTAGQPLVRIDARELSARESQASAAIADAEAARNEAATQAGRIRALYADSAATRSQLDAAETGLARSEAAARAARASAAEVRAISTYSIVRAPFAGVVTRRSVDPGAFAVPSIPLMTVQDGTELRVTASVTPDIARGIRRGQILNASVEATAVSARVEGVVPAMTGNMYSVNALVANFNGALLPGSTATLSIPQGSRTTLVVPIRAVTHTGDLTGVTVRTPAGDQTRWIRVGRAVGAGVEVLSGLRAGDQIVLPALSTSTTGGGR